MRQATLHNAKLIANAVSPSVVSMTVHVLSVVFYVHAEESADQPETRVVYVREHRRARGDGYHQQRHLIVTESCVGDGRSKQASRRRQRDVCRTLRHPKQRRDQERLED